MATQISPDGEYIEISKVDRSEDAAGTPMTSYAYLVVERVTYDNGHQAVELSVDGFGDDSSSINLSIEQGIELRDWLNNLHL